MSTQTVSKSIIPSVLFTFIFMGPLALAAQSPTDSVNGVPNTANYLDSVFISAGLNTYESTVSKAKDAFFNQAPELLRNKENELNVDFKCETVYRQWSTLDTDCSPDDDGGYGGCSIFDGAIGYDDSYEADSTVRLYCVPRSLQQQEIISLKATCEKSPQPQCFSQQFLDYLGKLQPTVYIDINAPKQAQ